jgi:hypothetical protein
MREVGIENDEINGNIDEDDMVPSIDSPTKEIRIIRKAKRIHRQNSGEGKAENGTPVPNNNKSLILNLIIYRHQNEASLFTNIVVFLKLFRNNNKCMSYAKFYNFLCNL